VVHQEQEQVLADPAALAEQAPVLVVLVQQPVAVLAAAAAVQVQAVVLALELLVVQVLVQDLEPAVELLQVELPVDLVLEQQPLRDNKKPKSLPYESLRRNVQAFLIIQLPINSRKILNSEVLNAHGVEDGQ
jgi:hypothetical protein